MQQPEVISYAAFYLPFLNSSTSTDGSNRKRAGRFKVATLDPSCGTLNINNALVFLTIFCRSGSEDFEASSNKE